MVLHAHEQGKQNQTTNNIKNKESHTNKYFYTPDPTLSLMSHDDLPAFHGQTLDHLYFDGPCSS
jgi:hypothetical protein